MLFGRHTPIRIRSNSPWFSLDGNRPQNEEPYGDILGGFLRLAGTDGGNLGL